MYVNAYSDIDAPTDSVSTPCGVGGTISAGESCRYTGSDTDFTLTVSSDGQSVMSGPGARIGRFSFGGSTYTGSINFNGYTLSKSPSGYTVIAIPSGVTPVGSADAVSVLDTDYLSLGYWLVVPDDTASAADYEVGVFADGANPFDKDNLMGLTGTANYSGDALGLHTSKSAADAIPDINHFTADVSLTADFGDGSALGSVSGTVSDFEVGGAPKAMTLNLGASPITNAAGGGFFNGDTSTTGFTGKWGGQFFGNGGSPTDHPGSAAGTFGATKNDGLESFIGAFGAKK